MTLFGYTLGLTADRGWGRGMVVFYVMGNHIDQVVISGEMALCVGPVESPECAPAEDPMT